MASPPSKRPLLLPQPMEPVAQPSRSLSRRHVLTGLGAAIGTAALGCSTVGDLDHEMNDPPPRGSASSSGSGGSGGQTSTGASGAGGSGGAGGAGDADTCSDSGGLDAKDLLERIETIVILCMENRSFDHYLGSLLLKEKRALDGLTGKEWNPDPNGVPVPVFRLTDLTVDSPPHTWDAVHQQWHQGQNDQFVVAHAGANQQEVMGYHTRVELPTLYALSDAFTVCDRYFCSLLGPTWPNRFFLHGATSHGQKRNLPVLGFTSIFDLLEGAGIQNKNYFGDIAWCAAAYGKFKGLAGIEQFFTDAAAGTLPKVSIIDPTFAGSGANDDHPDHDVKLGEALIASVFAALAKSPQWDRCLFVLTYDEHGGFFDHVAPPATVDEDPAFSQLGFRVPAIVAGPFARRRCTVSTQLEHVSVLRTVQTRFNLPSLNARMYAANDLSACIDPAFLDNPQKPPTLPSVTVSLEKVRAFRPRSLGQPELIAAAERGRIPWHLDRRAHSLAIAERVLEHGARLGAINLIG